MAIPTVLRFVLLKRADPSPPHREAIDTQRLELQECEGHVTERGILSQHARRRQREDCFLAFTNPVSEVSQKRPLT